MPQQDDDDLRTPLQDLNSLLELLPADQLRDQPRHGNATINGSVLAMTAINEIALPRPRRGLSADALIESLRKRFLDVPDNRRQGSCDYSMSDTLMSAFAMVATKEPSMLSFEDHKRELHVEKLFKIDAVPSDTQSRLGGKQDALFARERNGTQRWVNANDSKF